MIDVSLLVGQRTDGLGRHDGRHPAAELQALALQLRRRQLGVEVHLAPHQQADPRAAQFQARDDARQAVGRLLGMLPGLDLDRRGRDGDAHRTGRQRGGLQGRPAPQADHGVPVLQARVAAENVVHAAFNDPSRGQVDHPLGQPVRLGQIVRREDDRDLGTGLQIRDQALHHLHPRGVDARRRLFILLSDVLGFSALVDMINTRGGATENSNLGPFYLEDAPAMKLGRRYRRRARGHRRARVHGKVTDILHKPLPGAVVDTWQADASGTYPIQEQQHGQDKYDLRGVFSADENGRYYYTTVLPKALYGAL